MMTIILFGVIYAAALVFLVASIARAVMYAKAPVHLRWELYPVPHEEAGRVEHGGSYFETSDWWTKPTHFNMMGELKFMVPEMLFLKGLWEFNRKMWYRSFPFHFGLYMLIGTLGLLGVSALLSIVAPGVMTGTAGIFLQTLYPVTGMVGSVLAVWGAVGLLLKRLTDRGLKVYTTSGDIFNLFFFIVTLGILSTGYLLRSSSDPDMLAFSKGLLTLDTSLRIPGLLAAGIILSALLVAYVPLTHMSHFIAKYFTYHAVRWDDSPNIRGGKLEAKLAEYLTYKPTWAAPHMGADGTKTWAQVATTNPAAEVKK